LSPFLFLTLHLSSKWKEALPFSRQPLSAYFHGIAFIFRPHRANAFASSKNYDCCSGLLFRSLENSPSVDPPPRTNQALTNSSFRPLLHSSSLNFPKVAVLPDGFFLQFSS